MTKRNYYHWTAADDAYIRNTYDVDATFLAKTIGCSLKAVYNRRSILRRMDNAQRFVHVVTTQDGVEVARNRAPLRPLTVEDMQALREIERSYPLNDHEQRAKLKHFTLFETAYAEPKPTIWQRLRKLFGWANASTK